MNELREMEKEYVKDEIKEALLNPLYIFENVLGLELPSKPVVYISNLYKTLYTLFNSMLIYSEFQSNIDKILSDNRIDLNKVVDNWGRTKANAFLYLYQYIQKDIMDLHNYICELIIGNTALSSSISDLKLFLHDFDIDENLVYLELKNYSFCDDDIALKMSLILREVIKNIIENLSNVDKLKEKRNMKHKIEIRVDEHGREIFDIAKVETVKVDVKKKKKEQELRQNVNKMDKDFGCDLKHPKDIVDNGMEFNITCENYKLILARMLFLLNNIDSSNYIGFSALFGEEVRKIKIDTCFKQESKWFDNVDYSPSDIRYRARFLSYMIKFTMMNLKKIANVCYEFNNDGEFVEYEAKMAYVDYTMERLCNLCVALLENRNYEDDLMYFSEIIAILETKASKKKINSKIENLHEQSWLLEKGLKGLNKEDDDVNIDTMMKLAYMVCTNDPEIKGKFEFPDGYKFRNKKWTKEMIRGLGYAILKQKEDSGINKMFKYYIYSNPKNYCRWKDANDDKELLIGVEALNYFSFVVNNKTTRKKVNKLLVR